VRPAYDDAKRNEPADEEWLLIEWPEGDTEPDHYWLCTLPEGQPSLACSVAQMARSSGRSIFMTSTHVSSPSTSACTNLAISAKRLSLVTEQTRHYPLSVHTHLSASGDPRPQF
jgi:hypothetical protein